MPRMFRLTVLTLLAIMVTILVACGGAAPQITGAPTAGAAATAPATDIYRPLDQHERHPFGMTDIYRPLDQHERHPDKSQSGR
jgi:hypothetical protein